MANSLSFSSRPSALSASAISGMRWRPAPHKSASAASTQTGDARNATMPRSSSALPAVRRTRKSSGELLFRRVGALYSADFFDEEAEGGVDEVAIELAAAYRFRNRDVAHFTKQPGSQPDGRSNEPLRQRKQVCLDGHARPYICPMDVYTIVTMHTCAKEHSLPVTIKDIAKRVGVSHTTVSAALHGNSLISDETSERIRQVSKEMGYQPSAAARSLRPTVLKYLGSHRQQS